MLQVVVDGRIRVVVGVLQFVESYKRPAARQVHLCSHGLPRRGHADGVLGRLGRRRVGAQTMREPLVHQRLEGGCARADDGEVHFYRAPYSNPRHTVGLIEKVHNVPEVDDADDGDDANAT